LEAVDAAVMLVPDNQVEIVVSHPSPVAVMGNRHDRLLGQHWRSRVGWIAASLFTTCRKLSHGLGLVQAWVLVRVAAFG